MRKVSKIILFFLLIFGFSCEKNSLFVHCPDCTRDEPSKTELIVKLDKTYLGFFILVNVYEGNLEDNILYKSVYGSGTEIKIPVTLNKKYTLTASYTRDGKTYTVVDSVMPLVRYTSSHCPDPCYFVYDRNVDLNIKYY